MGKLPIAYHGESGGRVPPIEDQKCENRMKITEITRTSASVAVGMATLLALTACSGGSEGYDFTEPLAESVPSIKFTIPGELAELNEDYVENSIFDSVTVRSVESEDPSACAVEYHFDYADGGLERLLEYVENSARVAEDGEPVERRMAYHLTGESLASDEADGVELDEDFGSAVVPVDCAASPTDEEQAANVTVSLPWIVEGDTGVDGRIGDLASADVTVMRSGDLYVRESEVREWQIDSDGNWIKA